MNVVRIKGFLAISKCAFKIVRIETSTWDSGGGNTLSRQTVVRKWQNFITFSADEFVKT